MSKPTSIAETLHGAAASGNTHKIVSLARDFKHNVEFKINGRTPLHYAAVYGNPDAVSALFSFGANSYSLDDEGKTAFELAIANNKTRTAGIILTNCQFIDEAKELLLGVIAKADIESLKFLLNPALAVKVDQRDVSGKNIFHEKAREVGGEVLHLVEASIKSEAEELSFSPDAGYRPQIRARERANTITGEYGEPVPTPPSASFAPRHVATALRGGNGATRAT